MNHPDPIEDLYDMYSGKEKEVSRIVEVENTDLDFGLEDRLADLFLKL